MKRLLNVLRRATDRLRRPLATRAAGFVEGCVTRAGTRVFDENLSLVLDTLIAEQFRLQQRVEELHDLLQARSDDVVGVGVGRDHDARG